MFLLWKDFRSGKNTLLNCFIDYPDLYNKYLNVWLALTDCDTKLSTPGGRTNLKQREECAQACENFCKIFQ